MSRWLIANGMKGVVQDHTDDYVKTEVQVLDNSSKQPTEGKGAQLKHKGFGGDGIEPTDKKSAVNICPLEKGDGHTPDNGIA